jgi:hypothetical protein
MRPAAVHGPVNSSGRGSGLAESGCYGSAAFISVDLRKTSVTGWSRGSSERDAAVNLGVDRLRSQQRGRRNNCRDLTSGRLAVVLDGRRDSTLSPVPVISAIFCGQPLVRHADTSRYHLPCEAVA